MRWQLLNGKTVWKNDTKYKINWGKKSRSKLQFEVKQFLKTNSVDTLWFEEYTLPGTLLKVDFLNATKKVAIEVHGVGHFENGFNPHFHKDNRIEYLKGIKRDVKKAQILELNGYQLIEIMPEDVKKLSKEWFKENFQILI